VKSNYDTDVFQPLIQFIAKEVGVAYHGTSPATVTDLPATEDEKTDIAIRVIADHIRAIAFTIADGQLPSNVKAGYVIRRILRRAVRYAFSSLNQKQPFLYKLVPVLAEQMAGREPGPAASTLKIRGSELQQGVSETAMSLLGQDGIVLAPGYGGGLLAGDGRGWAERRFFRRVVTIYAGANEIQKTIIAKSILGM